MLLNKTVGTAVLTALARLSTDDIKSFELVFAMRDCGKYSDSTVHVKQAQQQKSTDAIWALRSRSLCGATKFGMILRAPQTREEDRCPSL